MSKIDQFWPNNRNLIFQINIWWLYYLRTRKERFCWSRV